MKTEIKHFVPKERLPFEINEFLLIAIKKLRIRSLLLGLLFIPTIICGQNIEYFNLDVKYKNQYSTSCNHSGSWAYGCGYYSLEMVLAYYEGRNPSETGADVFANWVEPGRKACDGPGKSATWQNMINYASSLGYDTYSEQLPQNNWKDFIRQSIQSGYPVICLVHTDIKTPSYIPWGNSGSNNRHWVVIKGYDDNSVYASDPGRNNDFGENKTVSWTLFENSISENNYRVVQIKNKQLQLHSAINTNKAIYQRSEAINGSVTLKNNGNLSWTGKLYVTLQKNKDQGQSAQQLYNSTNNIAINAGSSYTINFSSTLDCELAGQYYIQVKYEYPAGNYGFLDDNVSYINAKSISINGSLDCLDEDPIEIDTGGVNFSEINITGFHLNEQSGNIHLVMGGIVAQLGEDSINIQYETELKKKWFLQALSIPNFKQWISLNVNINNWVGDAVTQTPFENTDLAREFFTADVQMKFDLFCGIWYHTYSVWANILSQSPYYNYLLNKGFSRYPHGWYRGCLTPGYFSVNSEIGICYLDSARIHIDREIMEFNIDLSGLDISTAAYNDIQTRLLICKDSMQHELDRRADALENMVNNNNDPRYKKIREIYRIVGLATLYKQIQMTNANQGLKD